MPSDRRVLTGRAPINETEAKIDSHDRIRPTFSEWRTNSGFPAKAKQTNGVVSCVTKDPMRNSRADEAVQNGDTLLVPSLRDIANDINRVSLGLIAHISIFGDCAPVLSHLESETIFPLNCTNQEKTNDEEKLFSLLVCLGRNVPEIRVRPKRRCPIEQRSHERCE
jgi:hypothetical protein